MSFIKKNYEKILLGAVLLGLVGALLFLLIVIPGEQKALQDKESSIFKTPPKPLPALDMSQETNILGRVGEPYSLDFEDTNRLFNPVQWQKAPDGRLIKIATGNEVGPKAVKVNKISPLYYILRLDSVETANQFSAARYVVSIERQTAATLMQRRPRQHYLSVGDKDDSLNLVSVSGSADSLQLKLQILATGDTATVAKGTPYQRVDGYAADLVYPPQSLKWSDQHVGALLKNIDGKDYNIVVIDTNEVVVSAQSNQKKTTIPYQP